MRTTIHETCFALALAGLLGACSVSSPEAAAREIDGWIEKGREQLAQGQAPLAERAFERAQRLSPSLRTRMWLLRTWMEQGRINDSLDAIDALRRSRVDAGQPASCIELDYLYGMAFAHRARSLVTSGLSDTSMQATAQMNFIDAQAHLQRVVDQDGERFRDAYLWLARSAWANGDIDAARPAAEGAVRHYPDDGDTWLALGRVAMSQFVSVKNAAPEGEPSDETASWPPLADAHWNAAEEAFQKAIHTLGFPKDAEDQKALARAGLELGHALVWKERFDEAAGAYALSMTYNPTGTPYSVLHDILTLPREPNEDGELPFPRARPAFLHALEAANLALHARIASNAPEAGELSWWLGWERYEAGRLPGAERAFRQCVAERPYTANAWHYIGMCRYAAGDWIGTCEAMRKGFETDPVDLVTEMRRRAPELNVRKLDWVIAQLPEERRVDRAILSEICAEIVQTEPRHWNNMGLFLRDEADRIKSDPSQKLLHTFLCTEALRAYRRALETAPEDPQLLNDTAVILHYYLESEYEVAIQMYEMALKESARLLAEDLSADDRQRFQTARTDARNNLDDLRAKMKR